MVLELQFPGILNRLEATANLSLEGIVKERPPVRKDCLSIPLDRSVSVVQAWFKEENSSQLPSKFWV
jgi:hypothetical protein